MPWIQRIALTLLAFGFIGLGLIIWQPSSMATAPDSSTAYDLAISSGSNLFLSDRANPGTEEVTLLSCEKVITLGSVSIGTRCVSPGRAIATQD